MGALGQIFRAETGLDSDESAVRDPRGHAVAEISDAWHPQAQPAPDAERAICDAAEIDEIVRNAGSERSWPAPIRQSFALETRARQATEQQFLFILGLFVALSTILIDLSVQPAIAAEGAVLRVLLLAPITLLGLVAGARGWHQTMAFCVGAGPIAFAAVIVHIALHMPPENTARYLTATALVVGLANIILPYTMRGLVLFDCAFIIAAFGALLLSTGAGFVAYLDYLLLLCVVASATLPLAYRFDRLRQRNFLLNLRAEATSRELTQANQTLRELSERDPLTGMANRRYFERAFTKKIALLGQAGDAEKVLSRGRVAMMMIDLDSFKSFNDTNGHQAGDQCLQLVARALERIFGEADGIVARYGGEEFVAAIREREPGDAARLAEAVRVAIANLPLPANVNSGSGITTSVGVALSVSTVALPREDLIEMADAALYNAKRNGRDRIEVVEVAKSMRLTG